MSRLESYRWLFDRAGRRASLLRPVTNADPIRVEDVRIRLRSAEPEEIVGGVNATEFVALVLAEDVPAEWEGLKKNDAIKIDGRTMTFVSRPDDQTHREGDTLLAYLGNVSGS